MVGLTTSVEGRDGLLAGLDQIMRSDGAMRAQLASLIAKQINPNGSATLATPRRHAFIRFILFQLHQYD